MLKIYNYLQFIANKHLSIFSALSFYNKMLRLTFSLQGYGKYIICRATIVQNNFWLKEKQVKRNVNWADF